MTIAVILLHRCIAAIASHHRHVFPYHGQPGDSVPAGRMPFFQHPAVPQIKNGVEWAKATCEGENMNATPICRPSSSSGNLPASKHLFHAASSSSTIRRCPCCHEAISGSPKKIYCSARCRYSAQNSTRRLRRKEENLLRLAYAAPLPDPWKEGRLSTLITANALIDGWA